MTLDYSTPRRLPRYRGPVLICSAISILISMVLPIWQVMYRGRWEATFESERLSSALMHLFSGTARWHSSLLLQYCQNFLIAAIVGGAFGAARGFIARNPPPDD